MADPASRFHLLDEPTAQSVSLLTDALRGDSAGGMVSPKAYAHRSRVVRQQTALLMLRQADHSERGRFLAAAPTRS
jgi:hypothetical protein